MATITKLIDFHALRVFLATAECCNMSLAAAQLGISQSAVSQAIRNLEDYFGVVLVNRQCRPLALTSAGLALRNRGSTLMEAILNLRGSVIEASQGSKPDLRLGMIDSFAATCGTQLIQQMVGKVTRLTTRSGWTSQLGEALVRRDLDIVIATDPLEDINGILRHLLLKERFLVIVPKQVDFSVRTLDDLERLADALPMIRFNQHSQNGMQIERILRRHHIKSSRRLEVDTAYTLTSMVSGGVGWAITTPVCLMQGGQYSSQVTPVFIEQLNASRAMYVLAREDEYVQMVDSIVTLARAIIRNDVLPGLGVIHNQLGDWVSMCEDFL